MRKLSIYAFATLDGVVQAPGAPDEDPSGGFPYDGWSFPYWDEVQDRASTEEMAGPYDLLLGRRTYDIFAAYWPTAGDPVITPKYDAAAKYVATHRPDSLTWTNSHALGPDVPAAVRALKAGDGPDLVVYGSIELIQILWANDLVDQLRLWTLPLTLGTGKRLFGSGTTALGFEVVHHQLSGSGTLMTLYRRAERRPAGSFADALAASRP